MKKIISLFLALVSLLSGHEIAVGAESAEQSARQMIAISSRLSEVHDAIQHSDSAELKINEPEFSSGRLSVSASFKDPSSKRFETISISPMKRIHTRVPGKSTEISGLAEDDIQFVAQSSLNDIRIIAKTQNSASTKDIDYQPSFSKGAYLVLLADGTSQILNENGEYQGTFAQPWAIDAKGVALSTSLKLQTGILSQHIEVSPTTAYPVVSDPNWYYSLDLSLNKSLISGGYYPSGRTPAYVTGLLKSCFNCYFPVYGAPIWYPYVGQTMNLEIDNPVPYAPRLPAPVYVSSVFDYGWKFGALPGHVDGVGSAIRFTWYRDNLYHLHLAVSAMVVNPDPCNSTAALCQPVYVAFAEGTWQKMFNNVTG